MWSALRRRHGIERRIVRDRELIPWKIDPEHRHGHAVAMLRAAARKRAGKPLSTRTAANLAAWLRRLEADQTVVFYDRAVAGGWRYVPRREGIDLDLIREPIDLVSGREGPAYQIKCATCISYSDGRLVPYDPLLLH